MRVTTHYATTAETWCELCSLSKENVYSDATKDRIVPPLTPTSSRAYLNLSSTLLKQLLKQPLYGPSYFREKSDFESAKSDFSRIVRGFISPALSWV